jgi:hypothetical protein
VGLVGSCQPREFELDQNYPSHLQKTLICSAPESARIWSSLPHKPEAVRIDPHSPDFIGGGGEPTAEGERLVKSTILVALAGSCEQANSRFVGCAEYVQRASVNVSGKRGHFLQLRWTAPFMRMALGNLLAGVNIKYPEEMLSYPPCLHSARFNPSLSASLPAWSMFFTMYLIFGERLNQ